MMQRETSRDGMAPGPWHTDPETGDQSVLGLDGFMVADCAIFSAARGAPTAARCRSNAVAIAALPDLLSVLRTSAETFRFYERVHIEKGPDHTDRAIRNRAMAELCEAALSRAGRPVAAPGGDDFPATADLMKATVASPDQGAGR